jgi:integrase
VGRSIHKLTPEKAKHKSRLPGLHSDGGGLYLRVTAPKARKVAKPRSTTPASSWVFRYARGWTESKDGKRYPRTYEMGLGAYPTVSLATARERAKDAHALLARGVDPIQHRDAQEAEKNRHAAQAVTFKQSATDCIESLKPGWKNAKHAAQWESTLKTYAYPTIGDTPVADVDTPQIVAVLKPIWYEKTETASRLRGRIETVLDYAAVAGCRDAEKKNPARWRGHLDKLFPARSTVHRVEHHPALPYRDMPAFMALLADEEGVAAEALRLTILTAVRTDQTIGARWPELDLDEALWTVPGRRMKGKKGREREHRVPLTDPALAVLRQMRKLTGGHGYVFPGLNPKKHLSNNAMLALLERMGRGDITVHGFRSTFRDWTEEQTAFAGSVAEAALAHVVGDKVEAAYRRGDLLEKRQLLMEAWATFCTTPTKGADVIPIGRATKQMA